MDERERSIKEHFVSTIMEQRWDKGDIIFELLQHIADPELDSIWLDLTLCLQEEELHNRAAAA